MNITMIGTGYVGLVSGSGLADFGMTVICVDKDRERIEKLRKGEISFYEPGLEELVQRNVKNGRLSFDSNLKTAVDRSLVIFVAVGTPDNGQGQTDLSQVEEVAQSLGEIIDDYKILVIKSTVPVGTNNWFKEIVQKKLKKGSNIDIVSNPEFLREGSAIEDFMRPDRVVIGADSTRALAIMKDIYRSLYLIETPFVFTNLETAELIKYASNAFLATKISFINAISRICDKVGADVAEVAQGMGLDKRIGRAFLNAGVGYGGSCFPKDLDAFIHICDKLGYDFSLMKSVRNINEEQKEFVFKKVKDALWIIKDKTIGILGLAFKPNTDDIRNAPSLDLIEALQRDGAKIKVYDPQAMNKAKAILSKVRFCADAYEVSKGADCLLIITEWDEFKELDFTKIKELLKRPLIIDTRNIYDPKIMQKNGFIYIGIGRHSI